MLIWHLYNCLIKFALHGQIEIVIITSLHNIGLQSVHGSECEAGTPWTIIWSRLFLDRV